MRMILAGLACAWLAGGAAQANDFTPLGMDLPAAFTADVSAAKYHKWQANLPCGADTLRVTLRMDEPHLDKRWAASLHVALNEEEMRDPGQGDPDKQRVALVLGAVDPGAPVKFELQKTQGQRTLQQMKFSVPQAQGKSFAVEARWTDKGAIDFTVNGQALRPIAMDHAPASVGFVISGAKGEFSDVQAGRSGPPDAACPTPASSNGAPKG